MITSTISINNVKTLITIGAVRIFPVAPMYPRKGRLACYHCGEVIDGKIGGNHQFYLWHKYGDGVSLMAKVMRDYVYSKTNSVSKHPQFKSFDIEYNKYSKMSLSILAGKYHNLDGPCKIHDDGTYHPTWAIAGKLFYNESDFKKELSKYYTPPKIGYPNSDTVYDDLSKLLNK